MSMDKLFNKPRLVAMPLDVFLKLIGREKG